MARSALKYSSLFERLVANTAEPENAQACWIWTGKLNDSGYPRINVHDPSKGRTVTVKAHRKMLEIVHSSLFPFDEAGHLCYDRRCVNPDHLEVQTSSFNASERRGYQHAHGCCLPTLFPVEDPLQRAADWAWDSPGERGGECPF